jgi:hypothetical protein
MDKQILIYLGIALLVVIIIISLIKKAIKLVLFIAIILIVVSLVDVFVYGVSPVEQLNAYKTNIKYGSDITKYTGKIKSSVDTINSLLVSKNFDSNSIKKLNDEDANLYNYLKEVKSLNHTQILNSFHNQFISYLNTIISTTDTAVKTTNISGKAIQGAENIVNKLKTQLNNISSLKKNE